jgi:cytochrome c-type biogenesis protein CcmH
MLRKSAPSLLALLALGVAASLAAQTPDADSAEISAAIRTRPGDSVGRLASPEAAGRPADVVTERDNEELVKAIEHKVRCTCGCNLDVFTCRTTDFTCTTSPAMHKKVMARLDAGMTETQVLASFQAQYGEMIFMAPPRHGFNWAAYLMPYVGLAVGLGLLGALARRIFHARPRDGGDGRPPGVGPDAASPEDLEKLKRALEKFEA